MSEKNEEKEAEVKKEVKESIEAAGAECSKKLAERAAATSGQPAEQRTIKVSELLKNQAAVGGVPGDTQQQKQIELYTVLSRSLLELHNDMRDLRKKAEGLDKVMFSMQQGVNKGFMELSNRINNLDKELKALTEVWNNALEQAEAPEEG